MQDAQTEARRDARYPISRWYVRPIAGWAARWLAETRIRPSHLTLLGLVMAAAAVAILVTTPEYAPFAAIPVWLAWFYDRADGMLARRQGTISAWGAWFDANVDELTDLALQTAVAIALACQLDDSWPWFLLIAFLGGKYLLMYGLMTEEQKDGTTQESTGSPEQETQETSPTGIRWLYHLPGNCDVRVHWLLLMLLLNQLAVELAAVAVYYNLRWIVRYAIVWHQLGRKT